MKPSNILINYGTGEKHFKDVQLADLVGALPIDSQHLKDGIEMGTEIFRAPEAHLSLELGPPMDIWSFGATVSIASAMASSSIRGFSDPFLSSSALSVAVTSTSTSLIFHDTTYNTTFMSS